MSIRIHRPFWAVPISLMLLLALFSCHHSPRKVSFQHSELPQGLNGTAPVIHDQHQITVSPRRVRLTKAYFEQHHRTLFDQMAPTDQPEAIGFDPKIVVIHYTVIPTLEAVLDFLRPETLGSSRTDLGDSGNLNVGVQFIVDRDGSIYRFYPETVMSRHVIGLNHVSIGIENVANADYGTYAKESLPLTRAQLEANVALIRYLAGKHADLRYVIGHSEYRDLEDSNHPAHHLFHEDIPSYRTEKSDPGKRFMRELRGRLGIQ